MHKYGIIISNGSVRRALPLVLAHNGSEARRIANFLDSEWHVSRIETDPFMWNNCLYDGQAVGHTVGFCTANACY